MANIKNYLAFWLYRLNLHLDLVAKKRWRWNKFFLRESDVLEIGPGGGVWTIDLLLKKNKVTVVDIDPRSLERLRKKVENFPVSPLDLRLELSHVADYRDQTTYDQVIMFEVLEHIVNDFDAIQNLTSLLRPGGIFLISTPSNNFNEFYGSYDKDISQVENGGHVRKGYSFTDLERLLSRAGLSMVHKESCAGWATQHCLAFRRRMSDELSLGLAGRIFLRMILRPFTWFDFLFPHYPQYVNFIVATKD